MREKQFSTCLREPVCVCICEALHAYDVPWCEALHRRPLCVITHHAPAAVGQGVFQFSDRRGILSVICSL